MKIMLCEDDENLGMLLREYLQAKGYDTELCTDGEAGYKAFLKDKYDLCVLDVMMPKKDGFTLAKDIRQTSEDTPIIFLTAKTLKEDVLAGFKLGADDYITKPFSMEELTLRIEAILRRVRGKKNRERTIYKIGSFTFDTQKQILARGEEQTKLPTKESEVGIRVCDKSPVTELYGFADGLFFVQDEASQLCVKALDAKEGMRVLDACAAPGGKSAYLCETMQMTGRVFAWELHQSRALLLDAVKRRLRLENLRVTVRDATQPMQDWESTLDAVLLDAPCSGTGVITDKPDIKQRLQAEDIPAIVATQKQLLDTLCTYVKKGGTLVYSTCSILPEENALQVKAFLERNPNFALETLPASFPQQLRARQSDYGLQLQAYRDGVEGFFIARMRRVR